MPLEFEEGLTFDDVANAVQRSSIDLPGGSIKTDSGEILIRTVGQAYSAADFEGLVLVSRADGTRLTLADIGNVVDGFEESNELTLFDGEPAVLVQVYRVGQQSALEIASEVERYLERRRDSLPEGVHFTLAQNDARFLRGRLDTLLNNGWTGFLLVAAVYDPTAFTISDYVIHTVVISCRKFLEGHVNGLPCRSGT